MGISRVTHTMLTQRSVDRLQGSLGRLADAQEKLSTGKVLNRPSDSPADTAAAMRLRAGLRQQAQFERNASDGLGWLAQTDSTLQSMTSQLQRAHQLAIAGANTGGLSVAGREAIATELEVLRSSLIATANQTYLDRPVLGGTTAGGVAVNPDGSVAGDSGAVVRTIGEGIKVRVNLDATQVVGPGGQIFTQLAALANAVRAGDTTAIGEGITAVKAGVERVVTAQADAGTRYAQVEKAYQQSTDIEISLRTRLSDIEDADLAEASIEVSTQEVAYQAALASTARVIQPSLLDFLR
ncbi:hypothetical protein KLP28_14435 [Nocardioidaceae bacterium]|nr:hypothetical protein KLP28_14435 [Nocardioidaceae bacterium]